LKVPIVKLPTGELRDEIRTRLYDTKTYDAAATLPGSYNYFAAVQGKPLAASNLRQNNLLETAVSFKVQALSLDAQNIYDINYRVMPLLMEASSMQLKIGEKVYWEGAATILCGRIAAVFSIGVATASVTTVQSIERVYQHYGMEACTSVMFEGRHQIEIPPLQSFVGLFETSSDTSYGLNATEITNSTLGSATRLRLMFSMLGLLRRPVQ
jgi:hypothetical protein